MSIHFCPNIFSQSVTRFCFQIEIFKIAINMRILELLFVVFPYLLQIESSKSCTGQVLMVFTTSYEPIAGTIILNNYFNKLV